MLRLRGTRMPCAGEHSHVAHDDDIDLDAIEANISKTAQAKQDSDEPLSPVYAFDLDVKDQRGKRWQGRFTFNVPSLGDQIKIARIKSSLLPAGAQIDPNGALIAEMMAFLQVTLTAKPSWWKPERFFDPTPLIAAYKEARQYEARFLGADDSVSGDGTRTDEG